MDPNKAFEDLLKAIRWGNATEAWASYNDLKNWLDGGGFEPAWMTVIQGFMGNPWFMRKEEE